MDDRGVVLLTGASGFVGSALARRLLQSGFEVRALLRPNSPTLALSGVEVDIAHGDLRDRPSLRAAMRDVRWLFHAAADYRLWARNPAELYETNVEGTRAVMEEAMRAGVQRIVYTSSVATLSPSKDGRPSDETCGLAEGEAIGAYKHSKLLAERLVQDMVRDGLPAVIVNPSTPVGPRDVRPTPTGRIILAAASGRMPGFVDTGLNMVHVDDVARGHLAALEKGRVGEKYILGGQDASLHDILATVAGMTGRRPPRFRIPRSSVFPVAIAAEALARLTGREPLTTTDGLRMSRNLMYFSSAKAERELGYSARPYAEGIREAIQWFRDAGYLRS
jgi:dihydroflavonol-4-reductase